MTHISIYRYISIMVLSQYYTGDNQCRAESIQTITPLIKIFIQYLQVVIIIMDTMDI